MATSNGSPANKRPRADLVALRDSFGPKLMEIGATRDFDVTQALLNQYGIRFNTGWHHQIVDRYRRLDLAVFSTGIHPNLIPRFGANGRIVIVAVACPRDIARQQLRNARIAGKQESEN